jgi:AcrR family transcriptional regulator
MAGRPTERTEEVNRKIEEAAALGASTEEIAMYCGVHRATLYRWMQDDEELRDRIDELQERPILKARQTVVRSLDIPQNAQWYLTRKKKVEFAERQELTGAGGKPLPIYGGLSQHNSNQENLQTEEED